MNLRSMLLATMLTVLCILPAWADNDVTISARKTDQGDVVTLENKTLKADIYPGKGGRCLSLLNKATGIDYAGRNGLLRDGISSGFPGVGDAPYSYGIMEKGPETAVLKMWYSTGWGISIEKTVSMGKGPYIGVALKLHREKEAGYASLRVHNEIAGRPGAGSGQRIYYLPQSGDIRMVPVTAGMDRDLSYSLITGSWCALMNKEHDDGIVAVMSEKPMQMITWISRPDLSSMEWTYQPKQLASGDTWETKYLFVVGKKQDIYHALKADLHQQVDAQLARVLTGNVQQKILEPAAHRFTALEQRRGYTIFPVDPMEMQSPNRVPVTGEVDRPLSVFLTPGQYEPASFIIHALKDVKQLKLEISDLRNGEGVVKASCIDPYIIKCWYRQPRLQLAASGQRILVPDLLLKDDALITVDHENKDNYIRADIDGKSRYFCISKKNNEGLEEYLHPVKNKACEFLLPARANRGLMTRAVWLHMRQSYLACRRNPYLQHLPV
jgi:hypothetical protein